MEEIVAAESWPDISMSVKVAITLRRDEPLRLGSRLKAARSVKAVTKGLITAERDGYFEEIQDVEST